MRDREADAALRYVVEKSEELNGRWSAAERRAMGEFATATVSNPHGVQRSPESKVLSGVGKSTTKRRTDVLVARMRGAGGRKKKGRGGGGASRRRARGVGGAGSTMRGGTKVRIDRQGKVVVSNATPSKLDITLKKEWRSLQQKEMAAIMMERLAVAEEKRDLQREVAAKKAALRKQAVAVNVGERKVEGLFKQLAQQRRAAELDAATLGRARLQLERDKSDLAEEERRARAGWEKLRDAFDTAARDEEFKGAYMS